MIKILNRKPLLYLTLGGVIASGTPTRTNTIVVKGNAILSNNSIVETCLSSGVISDLDKNFNKPVKLYSFATFLFISSDKSKPNLTVDLSNNVVFKTWPLSVIVYAAPFSNFHPSGDVLPSLAWRTWIVPSLELSKTVTLF